MRIVNRSEKEAHIIQAAITAFAQNGYEKTSISDIASRAGIATGGIYNYFKNKEDLFERCCTHIYDRFTEGMADSIEKGNKVYYAVLYALRFFRSNIEYARILLMEAKNFAIRFPDTGVLNQWHERFVDFIQDVLRDELPPIDRKDEHSFYVSLMVGGIESILMLWLFRPGILNMTEEGIALQMARIVRHEAYREKTVG
ncbi:MAG TPA: TetR/AcrR family transcriptional regulator [Spirochaetota bacterium]|nr:TetR/AcrR family transcriptional regulator [Spirochaetota bacterium]